MNKLRVATISLDATPPSRKHTTDAGLDLFSVIDAVIPPNSQMVVPTGVMMDIPIGYVVKLWAKSRSEFLVGAGVVDAGYQGEIKVRIFNPSLKQVEIKKGEAITQAVILKCETPEVEIVSAQDLFEEESRRGATGGIHS
jgi:dUTP pyrophosphatase